MDTHTATCLKAYKEFVYNKKVQVAYSTAEWTKFSVSIINSIKGEIKKISDKEALNEIKNRFNLPIPPHIEELFSATIKHSTVLEKDKITEEKNEEYLLKIVYYFLALLFLCYQSYCILVQNSEKEDITVFCS